MASILTLLAGNARRKPVTLRFPDRPKPAGKYRGLVRMDPEKCLACGICEYVCVSASITVNPGEADCGWSYDPARCTFCGRCVRYCPGEALAQGEERPASYDVAGALIEEHTITYPLCASCGEPTPPFNETMLGLAFSEVTEELREKTRLCNKCRKHATGEAVKESFSGPKRRARNDGR